MSLTRACVYISIYRRLCFRFFLAFLVGTPPSTYLRVCMSVYSLACLGLGILLCIPLHVLSCFPALWFAHPFCFFVFLFSPSFFPFFSCFSFSFPLTSFLVRIGFTFSCLRCAVHLSYDAFRTALFFVFLFVFRFLFSLGYSSTPEFSKPVPSPRAMSYCDKNNNNNNNNNNKAR